MTLRRLVSKLVRLITTDPRADCAKRPSTEEIAAHLRTAGARAGEADVLLDALGIRASGARLAIRGEVVRVQVSGCETVEKEARRLGLGRSQIAPSLQKCFGPTELVSLLGEHPLRRLAAGRFARLRLRRGEREWLAIAEQRLERSHPGAPLRTEIQAETIALFVWPDGRRVLVTQDRVILIDEPLSGPALISAIIMLVSLFAAVFAGAFFGGAMLAGPENTGHFCADDLRLAASVVALFSSMALTGLIWRERRPIRHPQGG